MKKTLSLLVMAISVMLAQGQTFRQLSSITSDDGIETYLFSYADRGGRVIEIYHEEMESSGMFKSRDSIFYNEQGLVRLVDTWQYLNSTQSWKNTCKVEFEYDENGRLLSRKNFNNFGTWEQGGVYLITYNNLGQREKVVMRFAGSNEDFFTYTYTYDENGRLSRITSYFETEEYSSSEYSYNNLGQVSEIFRYSDGVSTVEDFVYENGNCVSRTISNSNSGNIIEKHEYLNFNNGLVSQTFLPLIPENLEPWGNEYARPVLFNNVNNYGVEDYYILDNNDNLQLYATYEYNYSEYLDINSIKDEVLTLYPNPAQDMVNISAKAGSMVLVYNLDGQVVMNQRIACDNTLDVSLLNNGTYILVINKDGQKSYGKLSISK